MKFLSLILISALLTACGDSYLNNLPTGEQIEETIEKGDFAEAKRMIRLALANDSLTPAQRWEMNFRIEKMERIEQDFSERDTAVMSYIKKFHPEVTPEEIEAWEK
ncbi:MAG: hypothetical protein CVT93_06685, partial [Bacteroidetes bacterium HGW-Bacteroidetes-10]